jgi:putative transcriptional regulator
MLKINYLMTTPNLTTTIRQHRLLADMTQEDLADRVGAVRQTIAYLERGEYMPSLALAWRIAQVFNKPLEEIFIFTDHEKY